MPDLFDVLSRFWTDLLARPSGPFAFRFVLQPLMAALLAIRDGASDAKGGHPPYFWSVLHDAEERHARLAQGLKATARVLVLGIAIDVAYQLEVLGAFYPVEALAVALALGFVPYLLIRGPADRIARRWLARNKPHEAQDGAPRGHTT